MNEKRAHTRIRLPLLVELTHATLGTVESAARDISDGGLFVELHGSPLTHGAQVKVRLRSPHIADFQHAPAVDMQVVRITDDGLGLEFKNKTAEHLWSSVERLREELRVGRDYFQVFQLLVVTHEDRGLLLVQQHGKWTFPGVYLEVAEDAVAKLQSMSAEELGIDARNISPVFTKGLTHESLPEASTFCVVYQTFTEQTNPETVFKDWRWVRRESELADITVAYPLIRELAESLLSELNAPDDRN